MKKNIVIPFLLVLLVVGLIAGCKKGEEYVDDKVDQLAKAEKLQDQNLAKLLTDTCDQIAIDSEVDGLNTDIGWQEIKKELDGKAVDYLEGLDKNNFSHGSLPASIRDKGWIQVRQGWIIIKTAEYGSYNFQFTEEKP